MKKRKYFAIYYKKHKELIKKRSSLRNKSLMGKFWKRWYNMIQRCENKNHNNYHLWGGRGIRVCERWKLFINFKYDMFDSYIIHKNINSSINTTLDRINVDGNYSKENCKWSTMKEQQNNRRNNK